MSNLNPIVPPIRYLVTAVFRGIVVGISLWLVSLPEVHHQALGQGTDFFESKIRPALHSHCLSCHNVANAKGGLALDSRLGILTGGDSGPAIDLESPDDSLLVRAIRHIEPGTQMPADAPKLSDQTIDSFVEWIKLGAADPRDTPESVDESESLPWEEVFKQRAQWWAFRAPISDGLNHQSTSAAIDYWISKRLQQEGITQSPPADPITLIRRLSFHLRGLPPEPKQLEQAVPKLMEPSAAEKAWSLAVDQALDSVEFAEHWARHWMDIVRYAETHGSEDDAYLPFAYRYRDYLVRAFHSDVPINRLIEEHLAGDLIEPRWNEELQINESLIGLCFYRLLEFNQTPVDVKREEIVVIDSQIDTIGKAFQALTISCARCHDHKFDPVSDEDYYSLYGILRSSRTAMLCIDRPESVRPQQEKLKALQREFNDRIFSLWRDQIDGWERDISEAISWVNDCLEDGKFKADQNREEVERVIGSESPWRKAVARWKLYPSDTPQRKWFEILLSETGQQQSLLDSLIEQQRQNEASWEQMSQRTQLLFDLRTSENDSEAESWRIVGPGLPSIHDSYGPNDSREVGWSIRSSSGFPANRLLEPGYHSNALTDRASGSLRSPDFVIESDAISLLCSGSGNARARLVIENFQGDSLLFDTLNPTLRTPELNWVTMRIRPQWKGLRAHVEVLTRNAKPYVGIIKDPVAFELDRSPSHFGLAMVIAHASDYQPPKVWRLPPLANPTAGTFISTMLSSAMESLDRLSKGSHKAEDVLWINTLIDEGLLEWNHRIPGEIRNLGDEYKRVQAALPEPRWIQGVVEDHMPVEQQLLLRGDHRKPGPAMPRKYLTVLGSNQEQYPPTESGRASLATEITSPSNPLTARVYVNRVWGWLFGDGIVESVDNFGRMGQQPTHPELLDQLAVDFVQQGWSNKKLIKAILMSQTWRRSSQPTEIANTKDPGNTFLSHANLRRLPAESIRDSLLWVSGSLKRPDSGLGTRNYYKSVLEPNKQSPPGPIDGDSRRSIYLEVRRNFPDEFLTVFDFPKPIATTGKRFASNTPLQSLMLLNDPFVLQQARSWSQAVKAQENDPARRIRAMYLRLLSRPPKDQEIESALQLINNLSQQSVNQQPDSQEAWVLLAHAMLNLKEAWFVK